MAWDERWKAVAHLVGYPYLETSGGSSILKRELPAAYDVTGLMGAKFRTRHAAAHARKVRMYAMQVTQMAPITKAGKYAVELSDFSGVTAPSEFIRLRQGYPYRDGQPFTEAERDAAESVAEQPDDPERLHYSAADLTVEYETPLYRVLADGEIEAGGDGVKEEWRRFTVVHRQPAGETVTVPPGYLRYNSDKAVVPNGIPLPERYMDLMVTWISVPTVPQKATDYLNCVNLRDGTFRDLWPGFAGFPKEKLLYVAVEPVQRVSQLGQILFDISYRFRMRLEVWNKIRRHLQATGGSGRDTYDYERVSVDGAGDPDHPESLVFGMKNLHELFQV